VAQQATTPGRPRAVAAPAVSWQAWHLHLDSPARTLHDRVISDVIGPAVAIAPGRPWFFVRYWESGPHLRLRIGDLPRSRAADVSRFLTEQLAVVGRLADGEEPLDRAAYLRDAHRLASAEGLAPAATSQIKPGGVYPASYEPELDRYGGAELMPASERMFQMSSELVLRLLPALPATRSRQAAALRATMSAGTALGGPAEQAAYYASALAVWRSWAADYGYSPDQIGLLTTAGPPDGAGGRPKDPDSAAVTREPEIAGGRPKEPPGHGPFTPWHHALRGLVAAVSAALPVHPGRIVFSHVHMFHNRLGLTLAEELRTYAWLAGRFPGPAGPVQPDPTPRSRP
jgi:hypothetical protein